MLFQVGGHGTRPTFFKMVAALTYSISISLFLHIYPHLFVLCIIVCPLHFQVFKGWEANIFVNHLRFSFGFLLILLFLFAFDKSMS
ncbi:hypothetical protein Peur_050558 [Populus x canadensis]